MSTVGVRLTSEDLVTLNRILGKMGYQTLGSFVRDIIRKELSVNKGNVDPDILQRLISIEQKINLLSTTMLIPHQSVIYERMRHAGFEPATFSLGS